MLGILAFLYHFYTPLCPCLSTLITFPSTYQNALPLDIPTYLPTIFLMNNCTRKGSILRAFLCKVEWLPLVGLIPPRNVLIPIGYWAPNPPRNWLTLILRQDVLPSMGKGFVPMLWRYLICKVKIRGSSHLGSLWSKLHWHHPCFLGTGTRIVLWNYTFVKFGIMEKHFWKQV